MLSWLAIEYWDFIESNYNISNHSPTVQWKGHNCKNLGSSKYLSYRLPFNERFNWNKVYWFKNLIQNYNPFLLIFMVLNNFTYYKIIYFLYKFVYILKFSFLFQQLLYSLNSKWKLFFLKATTIICIWSVVMTYNKCWSSNSDVAVISNDICDQYYCSIVSIHKLWIMNLKFTKNIYILRNVNF